MRPFNIKTVWSKLIESLSFEKYAEEMFVIAPKSPEAQELQKFLS